MISILVALSMCIGSVFAQDYALEDLNDTSEFFGELVGPEDFSGQVTLHYFGHFS